MADRKSVFVGYCPIESEEIIALKFRSEQSLLDGDIVAFSVDLSGYFASEHFQGLSCYDDDISFRIRRDCLHWGRELQAALEDGKTVLVFINDTPEISIGTGEKRYSGTGRNARTTRIVETFDPYSTVPQVFGRADAYKCPSLAICKGREIGKKMEWTIP